MITSLNGTIVEKEPDGAVIECGGVGFGVLLSRYGMNALEGVGAKTFLYIHMVVREDGMELYGFPTREERDCFRMITAISGIGPKGALAILSELTPEELAASVLTGDRASITRAKGIGPKAAERLVLELKDKFKGYAPAAAAKAAPAQGPASKSLEIIEALMALGFTQPEAKHALSGLDLDVLSVEQAITEALKGFSQ